MRTNDPQSSVARYYQILIERGKPQPKLGLGRARLGWDMPSLWGYFAFRPARHALRCLAAISRGRSPEARSTPITSDLPGGRVTSRYEVLPGQSKCWPTVASFLLTSAMWGAWVVSASPFCSRCLRQKSPTNSTASDRSKCVDFCTALA